MTALALYTTIFPGVEPYLADWYRSLLIQTDQDFELWIALDELSVEAAEQAMEGEPSAVWVRCAGGCTPGQIRQRALEQIVESCDAVVLVDSDDVLHPGRVADARAMLSEAELTGCGLRLVDVRGAEIGLTVSLPRGAGPEDVLPRHNVFGFSNSAFRSELLRRCLPIPVDAVLIDWLLATRAWLLGAAIAFSDTIGMDYRQHGANTARVLPPFNDSRVAKDTELVRQHFDLLQATAPTEARSGRLDAVKRAAADVESFYSRIVLDPPQLKRYVKALNALEAVPLWWSSVAHPSLRHMWTPLEENK